MSPGVGTNESADRRSAGRTGDLGGNTQASLALTSLRLAELQNQ